MVMIGEGGEEGEGGYAGEGGEKVEEEEAEQGEEDEQQQVKTEEGEEGGEDQEGKEGGEVLSDVKEADELSTEEFAAKSTPEPEQEQETEKKEEKKEEKEEKPSEEIKEVRKVDSVDDTMIRDLNKVFEEDENTLKEDLERLKALQQELAGETDDELEKFKCRLIEEMPLTESQEQGIKHFATKGISQDKLKFVSGEKIPIDEVSSESQEGEEDKRPYEEVFVEAIPGISDIVPDDLIEAVAEYMKNCAKIQHGIVMPRNIRHYCCPPLEAMDY